VEAIGRVLTPRGRIARYEALASAEPMEYEPRWRAAEAYAEVAMTEPSEDQQQELLRRGRAHATLATELEPDGIDGHYWRGVIAGMLADVTGGREKVRFGDEVYRESLWVVERDSLHAGAHYLQGRVHAGVMRLNSVMRFLAKLVVGGDALDNASWEKAEHHLARAARIQPELPMHHYELAMVYERLDWPDHFERSLRNTLTAPTSTPYQDEFKVRAGELLREIEG